MREGITLVFKHVFFHGEKLFILLEYFFVGLMAHTFFLVSTFRKGLPEHGPKRRKALIVDIGVLLVIRGKACGVVNSAFIWVTQGLICSKIVKKGHFGPKLSKMKNLLVDFNISLFCIFFLIYIWMVLFGQFEKALFDFILAGSGRYA